MFGEVDEHTTQETYLGHNMADAIACFHTADGQRVWNRLSKY